MIDRDHQLPITRQAQLLGLSGGAVYYLPKPSAMPTWRSVSSARADIADYFDWYNTARPHSSLACIFHAIPLYGLIDVDSVLRRPDECVVKALPGI